MTKNLNTKIGAGGSIASTSNIALVHTVMDALLGRAHGLPGIGTFYGKSGLGKSVGAAYASHPAGHNGIYVACRSFETKKSFVEQICKAIGIQARGNIPAIVDEIVQVLALTSRPLIVDEVDYIVESRTLELIRDLHDASGASILLIGEEHLPGKLKKHERFDNRVLVWQPAAACTASDFDALAKQYVPGIEIAPGLKARVLEETHGITRRVVVNLEHIKRWCGQQGLKAAPADAVITLYTGDAPGRKGL
ncbi:transposase [Comamonas testosteroni]|uniref:Transposase n=1 Tax=Comamonas testosteroni TaxID=285 RepID=A0A5A7MKN6_COMTE|nr:ATP-binding protein [Comamonas testosteroni]GEQ77444.1 transposase [Comamonas testosteroni]